MGFALWWSMTTAMRPMRWQCSLKAMGGATEVAYDGPSALAALLEFQPDVVLLDIGMPGMRPAEGVRLRLATASAWWL
jgi:CheY-like chemotaxis protein